MSTPSRNSLAWIDDELERLDKATLRRTLVARTGPQHARMALRDRELINFGSNDYLGLASDPRLIEAAHASATIDGWGSGASPLVSGRSSTHAALEMALAEFEGTEAALVFPSGFAANAGVIPALVDEPDAIFGDAKNHASIIDGCRLAKARRFIYPHGDCDALAGMLRDAGEFRRRLIVTDTLFSMDGDLAPLVRLSELAMQYDAMLMVDEAHATGVFGKQGRGVVEHLSDQCPELHSRISVRMGTLSKALGSAGGFICGSQALVDWLTNRARSYVFSTAPPAAASGAALAALQIVRNEPQRQQELLRRAGQLRARLREQGWNTLGSESQIIPLMVGSADRAIQLSAALREAGYFVPAIRPPSVPPGESLLRLSLCHYHSEEMIAGLLTTLQKLRT